jgi:hypothetical protein
VGGQVRVVALEVVDGVVDAVGHRFARAFSVVAEPAAAAAETQGVAELADERVAFRGGVRGAFEVVAGGGVIDVLVQLDQPGLVRRAGPVVEDGIGAGGGHLAGELRGGYWFSRPRE